MRKYIVESPNTEIYIGGGKINVRVFARQGCGLEPHDIFHSKAEARKAIKKINAENPDFDFVDWRIIEFKEAQ